MTRLSDTLTVLVDTKDVRVAEISLSSRREGDSHFHSTVTEHCYCLEGSLAVILQGGQRLTLAP